MDNRRLSYKDLSKFQISIITNGCGNKKFFVKPPDYIFEKECRHHDFRYYRGKGPSLTSWRFWMSPIKYINEKRRDRLESDVLFYSGLINQVKESYTDYSIEYEDYLIIAKRFFKAVRMFGWIFYNWGKEKTIKDITNDVSKKTGVYNNK